MRDYINATCAVALLALCTCPAQAESSSPSHRGSSPWSFTVVAEPSDTFVVNDADGGTIDRYIFRHQGPIIIDVPIRRYVGPTDSNGHLLNVSELVNRGVVSATATIQLPAYDVDQNTFPVGDCDGDDIPDQVLNEVDVVYLNDEKLGRLQGDNGIWLAQTFTVPIGKLKFPANPGATAVNRFRIEVDVANEDVVLSSGAVGCIVWAIAIDWIGVKFEASSPVIMVHGINSSGTAFANFRVGLEDAFLVADNSINLTDIATPDPLPSGCPNIPYNNSTAHNVDQLASILPVLAEKYGTDSIHIVAHSKGGLDSIGYLSQTLGNPPTVTVGMMSGQSVKRDLKVKSLVTLNTPFRGSVLAKYGVEARQLKRWQAFAEGIDVGLAQYFEGSYYCDLTPVRASAFTDSVKLPTDIQTASVATDADINGDGEISGSESDSFTGGAFAANLLYQLVGSTASVTITVIPVPWGFDEVIVEEIPTAIFRLNDAIVPVNSANEFTAYPIDGWHHLNVHSEENADRIAEDAQASGLIDWRLR